MNVDLKKVSLEEIRISLATDMNRKDRVCCIKLAPLNNKSAPFAEILSFFDLFSRRNVLSLSIDVRLERSNKTLYILFGVMRLFDAVSFKQGLGFNLHLSKSTVLSFDLAKRVVVSSIPIVELSQEIFGAGVLQALFINLREVDVHRREFSIGGLKKVNLFRFVELDFSHHLMHPPRRNGHHLAQNFLLLLPHYREIDLIFMQSSIRVSSLNYQNTL